MTFTALASLALLQLLLAMSPGPATVLTIRTAASEGLRTSLALALGLAIGVTIWAMAALAGLAIIFEIMPWIQTGLRVAGALFLVWIGLQLWRHADTPIPETEARSPRSFVSALRLGIFTDLANPKALVYFAAIFTGLLPEQVSPVLAGTIIAIVFSIELVWYTFVAAVFSRPLPRRFYARIKAGLERTFGVVLTLFGLRIAAG